MKGKIVAKFIKPKMICIQNSLSFDMIKIPSKKYEIGKYPVTIAEYMYFARDNKEHLPEWKEKLGRYEKINLTSNAPIVGVSWNNAVAYCNWLNEQQKRYIYRLPREAEWEYACRANTTTAWSFGDDEDKLEDYAWYDKNSYNLGEEHEDYGTHIVGEKLPNPWGVFDMHGNVWEWCEDWHSEEKKRKVLRSGSWFSYANDTRSTIRFSNNSSYRYYDVGFRLLRTLS